MTARREIDEAERARIDREASGWAVLLQEEPEDPVVQAEFAAWLEGSSLHRSAWAETQRITLAIRTVPPAHAATWQGEAGAVLPFRQKTPRRPFAIFALAAAACLAAVAGPGLFVKLRADVATGTGELRSVRLADGSAMQLAPESAVVIDVVRGGQREVHILSGRAWFEVAPDRLHPFRVTASDTTTTVLGTGFEVGRIDRHRVKVDVRHGRVRVACDARPEGHAQLTAGDSLGLECSAGTMLRSHADPSMMGAWADGQIVASDRPVAEVISALRPWHRGVILSFGAALDQRRVTGVYDARQPNAVLKALGRSQRLAIRNLTPWITVVSPN